MSEKERFFHTAGRLKLAGDGNLMWYSDHLSEIDRLKAVNNIQQGTIEYEREQLMKAEAENAELTKELNGFKTLATELTKDKEKAERNLEVYREEKVSDLKVNFELQEKLEKVEAKLKAQGELNHLLKSAGYN